MSAHHGTLWYSIIMLAVADLDILGFRGTLWVDPVIRNTDDRLSMTISGKIYKLAVLLDTIADLPPILRQIACLSCGARRLCLRL